MLGVLIDNIDTLVSNWNVSLHSLAAIREMINIIIIYSFSFQFLQ